MLSTLAPCVVLICVSGVCAQSGGEKNKPADVVLRIPFAEGERHTVWRGPGEKSHSDRFNRYAVDFSPLTEGHVIRSATAGKVVFVKEDTVGPTGEWRDNNEVAIRMPNGKDVVVYLHLIKGGVDVEVGDEVLPGDPIGRAGNTGNSEATHLHIDVRKAHRLGPSIPWRFAVVPADTLVRAGRTLRSENVCIRDGLRPLRCLQRATELVRALGEPALVARRFRDLRSQKTSALLPAVAKKREELLRARDQEAIEFAKRIQQAPPADRPALAWTMREAFGNCEAGEAAGNLLLDLSSAELRAVRKKASERAKKTSSLRQALTLEAKLASSTKPGSDKQLRRLDKAFARAIRGWPAERAALVEKHVATR